MFGNKRIVFGTFVSDSGSTGGEVPTGLSAVDVLICMPTATVGGIRVNETFPLASGSVTIESAPDESGVWMAIGDGLV